MNRTCHSDPANQARVLAIHFSLLAAACLPGKAIADSWTHDSVYGAATGVALPGGQATLARDGADQQARTLTHVSTAGVATTIARDYGPSGSKAVELENGALRHHVYGGGLAPLLRVESDGSLTYQVGADTVSVDATGSATVAHRIGDLKRSTVAVLDTAGQSQQRVAYSTLGQSTSQQDSGDAYADAAQLAGYEGLTAWQLGTDQLIDNRARVYAPVAGRFLALDAAHQALGYEARGNDWITRVDYDGYLDELVDALEKDRSIVVAIGENHTKQDGIVMLMALVDKLEAKGIPFKIYQEDNLLVHRNNTFNGRITAFGFEERLTDIYHADRLFHLAPKGGYKKVNDSEKERLFKRVWLTNKKTAAELKDYSVFLSASRNWDIRPLRQSAGADGIVTILFTGAHHLLDFDGCLFHKGDNDEIYKLTIHPNDRVISLQPATAYDLVFQYKLLGIVSNEKKLMNRIHGDPVNKSPNVFEAVVSLPSKLLPKYHSGYILFTHKQTMKEHPQLKPVFIQDQGENKDEDDENNGDGKNDNNIESHALMNAPAPHSGNDSGAAEQKKEESPEFIDL